MSKDALALIRVIFFFSYFGYPLTRFELWKWQQGEGKLGYGEMDTVLERLEARHLIEREGGFIATSNRFGGVSEQRARRHAGFRDAVRKHRGARFVIRFLAMVGGVEGVAICNSLAMHNTHEDGDLDLFVLTKSGALWKSRLAAVLPMLLLRKRPGEAASDAVDMSFFVAEDGLDVTRFAYDDDPYYLYWLAQLIPVHEAHPGRFDAFAKANAAQLRELAFQPVKRAPRYRTRAPWFKIPNPVPERLAKRIQLRKLPKAIQDQARSGDGKAVAITSSVLKFHTTDRRQEIAQYINQRMKLCEELL
jgi:hypothetical protein